MTIAFHDTLTGQRVPFEPREPGKAKVYVCGPTVYDYAHLGHVRCYTVFDVLVKHLRDRGLEVTYVRNYTDVDDKILKRAAERGESPLELSRRFTDAFLEDMARLHVARADIEPKVSEHIDEIVALVQRLVDGGHAYAADGDVYFDVRSFPAYGKLSHRKLDDLATGASGRTGSAETERKRHPADFALWKKVGDDEALGWDSPWGRGRPGWHIECSAMSMKHLGESFDLHGGGLDLVFPHHENELAQSEAATGSPFARVWVHNGFVEVAKEKMSKSLGNFFTARELMERVEPEALRWFVLTVGYRSPLNFDWDQDDAGNVVGFPSLEEAERRVEYLYRTRARLAAIPDGRIISEAKLPAAIGGYPDALAAALDDDLDFPEALAATAAFLSAANEVVDGALRKKGKAGRNVLDALDRGFAKMDRVLGVGGDDPSALLERIRARRVRKLGLTEADVDAKLQARAEARAAKDFTRADGIRDELAEIGIEVMDSPTGSTWRVL